MKNQLTIMQEAEQSKDLKLIKKVIWVYFFLIIFEGALRKWVLPGLATPLLIIRDPLAVFLVFKSMQTGYFKSNVYVLIAWVVSVISFFASLLFGHGNVWVALFGFRILVLHFPLIFVIGSILDKDEVVKIGKVLLWIHIGMTVLVAIQFYSPQSAWVNRGLGGDETGSGFSGAAGFFRVPGTFSFTNGLSMFYALVGCFVIYFWVTASKEINKWFLLLSTVFLLAAIPLTISRTVFFQLSATTLFAVIIAAHRPKQLMYFLGGTIVVIIFFFLLSNFSFFQTASFAFTERFTNANESEGGVEGVFFDRFLGGMIGALASNYNSEFFGMGLGMGTNVGATLMTGGRTFLISEGEWGRLIGEMGIFIGFIVITLRSLLILDMFKQSWKSIGKQNFLPWLLFSFVLTSVLQGQWAQPTALGFSVFAGGLLLASLKDKNINAQNDLL
jgi:hypothetical protein